MGFSLSGQTTYFLWSIVLGLALGALYDIVRAVRMLTKARQTAVIITDILFFTICGALTSLFALPFNKGSVRGFIIFGEAVGFLSYRLTAGSIMGKIYAHIARILRRIIQIIHKKIIVFFDLLLKMTSSLVYNVNVLIYKLRTGVSGYLKKHRKAAKQKKRGRRKDIKHEQKNKSKHKHKGREVRR